MYHEDSCEKNVRQVVFAPEMVGNISIIICMRVCVVQYESWKIWHLP